MSRSIAVFGASGLTGRVVIATAAARGHFVNALVRSASPAVEPRDRLRINTGDLDRTRDVEDTIRGCSAVICLFGPRPPFIDIFCAEATRVILAAMNRLEVPRIICQTGAMIGDWPDNRTWAMALMARAFSKRFPEIARDRAEQERLVMRANARWTLLKPPRLTNGSAVPIAVGPSVRVGLLSHIPRLAIGEVILEVLDKELYEESALFLKAGAGGIGMSNSRVA